MHVFRWVSDTLFLARLSMCRTVRSRQTVVCALLLAFAAASVTAWSLRHGRTSQQLVEELLLPVYVSLLLPLFCLCYASPAVAADREDRTLAYLLATPLPRPLIFTAKYAAAMGLALGWSLGVWAGLAWLAGPVGRAVVWVFFPAAVISTASYTGLFCLFSVLFRRATIAALVYAVFLEALFGNMPGVVKRLAISFYTQCLILDAGKPLGLNALAGRSPELFMPVSGSTAWTVLGIATILFFAAGVWLFSRQEY